MSSGSGKYSRTNYRLTGAKRDVDGLGLQSQLVNFEITIQHDSAGGDVVTFSMQGYGRPAWVFVQPRLSACTFTLHGANPRTVTRTSVTADSSLVYMTVQDAEGYSLGSLSATESIPYVVVGLIASR